MTRRNNINIKNLFAMPEGKKELKKKTKEDDYGDGM
jgi:hypothetical protein